MFNLISKTPNEVRSSKKQSMPHARRYSEKDRMSSLESLLDTITEYVPEYGNYTQMKHSDVWLREREQKLAHARRTEQTLALMFNTLMDVTNVDPLLRASITEDLEAAVPPEVGESFRAATFGTAATGVSATMQRHLEKALLKFDLAQNLKMDQPRAVDVILEQYVPSDNDYIPTLVTVLHMNMKKTTDAAFVDANGGDTDDEDDDGGGDEKKSTFRPRRRDDSRDDSSFTPGSSFSESLSHSQSRTPENTTSEDSDRAEGLLYATLDRMVRETNIDVRSTVENVRKQMNPRTKYQRWYFATNMLSVVAPATTLYMLPARSLISAETYFALSLIRPKLDSASRFLDQMNAGLKVVSTNLIKAIQFKKDTVQDALAAVRVIDLAPYGTSAPDILEGLAYSGIPVGVVKETALLWIHNITMEYAIRKKLPVTPEGLAQYVRNSKFLSDSYRGIENATSPEGLVESVNEFYEIVSAGLSSLRQGGIHSALRVVAEVADADSKIQVLIGQGVNAKQSLTAANRIMTEFGVGMSLSGAGQQAVDALEGISASSMFGEIATNGTSLDLIARTIPNATDSIVYTFNNGSANTPAMANMVTRVVLDMVRGNIHGALAIFNSPLFTFYFIPSGTAIQGLAGAPGALQFNIAMTVLKSVTLYQFIWIALEKVASIGSYTAAKWRKKYQTMLVNSYITSGETPQTTREFSAMLDTIELPDDPKVKSLRTKYEVALFIQTVLGQTAASFDHVGALASVSSMNLVKGTNLWLPAIALSGAATAWTAYMFSTGIGAYTPVLEQVMVFGFFSSYMWHRHNSGQLMDAALHYQASLGVGTPTRTLDLTRRRPRPNTRYDDVIDYRSEGDYPKSRFKDDIISAIPSLIIWGAYMLLDTETITRWVIWGTAKAVVGTSIAAPTIGAYQCVICKTATTNYRCSHCVETTALCGKACLKTHLEKVNH